MNFTINELLKDLPKNHNNCDFSIIPISNLEPREQQYFNSFMPKARSAIVVYYPVKKQKDWTWNCPDGTLASERCNVDDWANEVCESIQTKLVSHKIPTTIVPYPHDSGLQFRYVAVASGFASGVAVVVP